MSIIMTRRHHTYIITNTITGMVYIGKPYR
ncbi:hypothetical protein VP150E351_P0189 [Vibrio phage 150E35-1]|nr:hypothetical protein VP150E351_P0189 [Vibrio phage 150E35-1]